MTAPILMRNGMAAVREPQRSLGSGPVWGRDQALCRNVIIEGGGWTCRAIVCLLDEPVSHWEHAQPGQEGTVSDLPDGYPDDQSAASDGRDRHASDTQQTIVVMGASAGGIEALSTLL